MAGSPAGWAGGGLLAAGIAVLVARRRGSGGEPALGTAVATEVALRLAADEHRSALVDRALRLLAQRCGEAARPAPGAWAAVVDDDGVELRLSPADGSPPPPWEPADDGRVWRLAASALPRRPLPAASPLPYLVGVGRDAAGRDVLLDLAGAGGAVAVTGWPGVAREVAAALAVQLAVHPWCATARVATTVLPDGAAPAAGERLRPVADLGEAVGGTPHPPPDAVLTGRVGAPADGLPLALVEAPAAAPDQRALVALADRGERVAGVLVVGPVPGARWELAVDDAGNLRAPALGLDLQAPPSHRRRRRGRPDAAGHGPSAPRARRGARVGARATPRPAGGPGTRRPGTSASNVVDVGVQEVQALVTDAG